MANQQQIIDDQAKRIQELGKALGFYADFDDDEVVARFIAMAALQIRSV